MHVPVGHKQPAVLSILTSGSYYLLLRRSREPNRDRYTPVGGKMDAFESPAQAVVRETAEETGFLIKDVRFCGVLVDNSPTINNWICFVYRSEIAKLEPTETNEGTLEWIHEDFLSDLPIPTSDSFIYEYIKKDEPFVFNAYYDNSNAIVRIDEEIAATTIYERSQRSASL